MCIFQKKSSNSIMWWETIRENPLPSFRNHLCVTIQLSLPHWGLRSIRFYCVNRMKSRQDSGKICSQPPISCKSWCHSRSRTSSCHSLTLCSTLSDEIEVEVSLLNTGKVVDRFSIVAELIERGGKGVLELLFFHHPSSVGGRWDSVPISLRGL